LLVRKSIDSFYPKGGHAMAVEIGKKAPAFTLESHEGKKVKLSEFKGKRVVLYFYPKDMTSGCTLEAEAFRDVLPQIEKLGAVVLGVSPDSVESHCKFIQKNGLNFTLLADPDHKAAEAYGVWVEKNMYGKKYMGIQRATFLVDEDGRIAKIWPKVKPKGHAQDVLDALAEL